MLASSRIPSSFFDQLCQANVFILDGGLASQLEVDGMKIQGDPLWSARALITNPNNVVDVHKRLFTLITSAQESKVVCLHPRNLIALYLAAGARIIETNSYQAALPTLRAYFSTQSVDDRGDVEKKAHSILRSSVVLARQAIREFCQETGRPQDEFFVAGSIGPYAVILHDGSEYSGDYVRSIPPQEIVNYYFEQMSSLTDVGVDLLAFETIPSLAEANLILEAIDMLPCPPAPLWISFSCRDGTFTCGGDRFEDVVSSLGGRPVIGMIGINCTSPRHVTSLLGQPCQCTKPFVVYPNSGERWQSESGWQSTADRQISLATYAPEWISRGAKIIGGCCRIGPTEINQLSEAVANFSNPFKSSEDSL